MATFKGIPITPPAERVRSGEKYRTPQGFTAIKDGVKSQGASDRHTLGGKPRWLKAPLASGVAFDAVRQIVREHRLSTVCEEAKCPNIGECWNAGTATIMVMGAVCTRACRFCSVDTGNPRGWLDAEEPANVARSVSLMRLKYVVLTSVDRDDLADGGAAHYAACVRAIKEMNPGTAVEALTPDFQGALADVETVIDSGVEVFAQNVETVRRLTHPVRDPRAGYEQTIAVLAHAKRYKPSVLTKTSLMLGLGESGCGDSRDARGSARSGRRHRYAWSVPAPDAEPSARRAVRDARGIRELSRAGPGARVSRSAFPGRWCARAIAPSAHWSATTRDSMSRRPLQAEPWSP